MQQYIYYLNSEILYWQKSTPPPNKQVNLAYG